MKRYLYSVIGFEAFLLLLALWVNRPTYLFINKVYDAKAQKDKFAVCAVSHRWGTRTVCPTDPRFWTEDYRAVHQAYSDAKVKLEEMSLMQRWRYY